MPQCQRHAPGSCEAALAREGLPCFRTPDTATWAKIRERCADHLDNGRTAGTLPQANKIWMLYGFELHTRLRARFGIEVIETYPYAVVRQLLPTCQHKSTEDGYCEQHNAVASATGWSPETLEARLRETVPGSRHDRLDAFMAAWVASLPPDRRRAFGDAANLNDSIWVPT